MPAPVLRLDGVRLTRDDRDILSGIDWAVEADERWVVLGANGCGKTSLIRIAGMWLHPSAGRVEVLGEELGRTDVRVLRRRIGFASGALADQFRADLPAIDVVVCGLNAALEPWWHTYTDEQRTLARQHLEAMGCGHVADHPIGTLSSGERQRALLARILITDPGVVLLDEPTAGLDLPGREALVGRLSALALDPSAPPQVLVTHHVEEIPPGFTHALLLRDGRIVAAGPLADTLRADTLGDCLGMAVRLRHECGRWSAVAG